MALNLLKKVVLPVFLGFISFACAKIGRIEGGPKDITPPKVVQSKPAINSTNFDGKKVEITFDEYVQLTDINKNLVISPPMKKNPTVILRNKSVVLTFDEPLKPNATYRLYFGNAIGDLNQNNLLKNYEFVFSTGNVVDSLSLRGRVIDAFDHKPDKESYFVMLYDKYHDSIPRKQLPEYITKTDDHGFFSITHVRPDTFMIFALKDMNMNMRFDLPNEPIAFSDTLITMDRRYFMPDSLIKPDSTNIDSTQRGPFKAQIKLYSFTEKHDKQYLKKQERTLPEKLSFIFNVDIMDSLQITPLNFNRRNWLMPDINLRNDTMNYWITDTSIVYKDTLKLRLGYSVYDSLQRVVPKYDTVSLVYKKPLGGKVKSKSAKTKIEKLLISSNSAFQPMFDLNNRLVLTPNHPLVQIDTSKIRLIQLQDGKKSKLKYTITHDSISSRRYYVNFKLEPQTDYELTADSMSFRDEYGQWNDSTGYKFKSQKDDYYGKITLKMQNIRCQMIIQLLSAKGDLVAQKIIDKDEDVVFDFVHPEKYRIRAIYDWNKNKMWDTGDFGKRLQPEKIIFYNKEIPVRSNWFFEEPWKLE